ncbi:MAG: hypothetical protein IJF54_07270 [Clostridia bacterium]|nr:hypothetical protein [Clostridia bacterium]
MNTPQNAASPRVIAQQKYASARHNLLLMIIFTVVNIVLLIAQADLMLLFSATIPYFSAIFGVLASDPTTAVTYFGIAAVVLVLYLACWILSKKHYGWMVAALILFLIDTLTLAWIYITSQDTSGILDALIHVWVLFYLFNGVRSGHKLKNMPEEEMGEICCEQCEPDDPVEYKEPQGPEF